MDYQAATRIKHTYAIAFVEEENFTSFLEQLEKMNGPASPLAKVMRMPSGGRAWVVKLSGDEIPDRFKSALTFDNYQKFLDKIYQDPGDADSLIVEVGIEMLYNEV